MARYGLNAWVIVVSGELSIVNVAVEDDEELPLVPVPVLELDEHAASTAADDGDRRYAHQASASQQSSHAFLLLLLSR